VRISFNNARRNLRAPIGDIARRYVEQYLFLCTKYAAGVFLRLLLGLRFRASQVNRVLIFIDKQRKRANNGNRVTEPSRWDRRDNRGGYKLILSTNSVME
jgi:hypothetical protein